MSCFASYLKKCVSEDGEHNFDIALDVINQDKLRICCLNGCGAYFGLEITQEQFDKLYEMIKDE